jgi:hypothetical protein
MTESQWLKPGDLTPHVEWLWKKKRLRKLRLFSVACCRQLEPWIDEPLLLEAIERAERLADGELSDATINKWRQKVNRLGDERRRKSRNAWTPQLSVFDDVRFVCHENQYFGFVDCWRTLVYHGKVFGRKFVKAGPGLAHALLLDVFGNPFRPVEFDKQWRTDTAVSLARGMYDTRDFGAMPILADALQDAGCDNDDVLDHCRGSGPHVRGCWVVDLVLGKA